jgi:hypothetical protein
MPKKIPAITNPTPKTKLPIVYKSGNDGKLSDADGSRVFASVYAISAPHPSE